MFARLTGAILFEAALTTATGGAAVAVRAGKLTKLLDGFGFLNKKTVDRIESIVDKFLKKADNNTNQSSRPVIPIIQSTCFAEGTPILTPTGAKRIEEFKAGDSILSRPEDEVDAPVRTSVVEEVFKHSAPIMRLIIAGQVIGTTAEHPFYVSAKGWTAAKHLESGDLLLGHDSKLTPVELVTFTDQFETVYNLRVAFDHTYFVGGDDWGFSVWAHNTYSIVSEGGKFIVRNADQADMAFDSIEDMLKFYGKKDRSELLDYLNGSKGAIGFAQGTAANAVRNVGRVDHAGRHLSHFGVIAGNQGTKAFREAVSSNAIRILENPLKTFDHVIGSQQVIGFYGMIDGKQVVFFVAKEARGKIGIGELVTSVVPSPQQIIIWGL